MSPPKRKTKKKLVKSNTVSREISFFCRRLLLDEEILPPPVFFDGKFKSYDEDDPPIRVLKFCKNKFFGLATTTTPS